MLDMVDSEATQIRMPDTRAQHRRVWQGRVATWLTAFVVIALVLTWFLASAAWFLSERDDLDMAQVFGGAGPAFETPAATTPLLRAAPALSGPISSDETYANTENASASTPPMDLAHAAAVPVLWVSENADTISFVGIDVTPVWSVGFAHSPVAGVQTIRAQSDLASVICEGDRIISIDGAPLTGLSASQMTRALDQSLYQRDRFSMVIAPAAQAGTLELVWGAAPPAPERRRLPERTCG